jgi:hypothetical protein
MFKEEQFKLATLKQSADEMAQLLEQTNSIDYTNNRHKAIANYKKLI